MSQLAASILRTHECAMEGALAIHFESVPTDQMLEHQRAMLMRFADLPNAVPGHNADLRAVLRGIDQVQGGICQVWTDARFISPIVACSATRIVERTAGHCAIRPVLIPDDVGAVFGVRLVAFTCGEPHSYDHTLFIQATARATFLSLEDPDYFLEAMGEMNPFVKGARFE